MTGGSESGAGIELEELTKRYPGQAEPAVDHVTMHIPAGEIVVLVGPSGCGKTTLLKMINRIIEPTSGRIVLNGEDVTRANPDLLRRRIGYVIQQIGLFPHMTVAQNVAMVPRLLGWDKAKVEARVDELLDLVGLDPAEFRSRYPKELSGGQRQRVGVARALGGDPPVMLMDEPFGAIDPITRERLQNEFLRIQQDVHKTIVFVTHDIDEAIKLGDRIAVLSHQSHIEQYDRPATILTAPANSYVEDFIGAGAVLKRLGLSCLRDLDLERGPVVTEGAEPGELRAVLDQTDQEPVLVLDDDGRPRHWVTADAVDAPDRAALPVATSGPEDTLLDTLNELVASTVGRVAATDSQGRYTGTIDLTAVMRAVDEMRATSETAEPAGAEPG